MTIKAIGFDLDGTLLNTHVDYYGISLIEKNVCKKHNIPYDELEIVQFDRVRSPVKEWLETNGRGDEFESINKELDDEYLRKELEFFDEATAFKGTLECIDAIKSKGYKVGLLTRGGYEYGRCALEKFGILDSFDAIVGRDYTSLDEAKPSPKAMYAFAKELGVKPEEIIYIGDNLTDYRCARDSGATFFGVTSGHQDKEGWAKEDPGIKTLEFAGDILDHI